ncbi:MULTISPECIES: hypothetical protein [unclassified Mesorhizobium]|nr:MULTISPECIES: hypothetical protein [unclassified Mesorhizobium]
MNAVPPFSLSHDFNPDDSYLEFRAAGSEAWQDMMSGAYRRVSPHSINGL